MRTPTLILLVLLTACTEAPEPEPPAVSPYASVAELQALMAAGTLSSEALTAFHLERIKALDDAGPELGAILEIAPDAMEQAIALDAQRSLGHVRGPLHGIPVVIKANIDAAGLHASAGSLALLDHAPETDAPVVAAMRDAGAVILGTANLSEWANFRSSRSTSGWSSIGRQTKNPYALDRNPCGSSSGSAVAVAAGLSVLAVGTETDGSVVCPASHNGVVGIKPTLGLVSREGIIPIAMSQDTAGPMGRTVRDAAALLQAMLTPGPAAGLEPPEPAPDYLAALEDTDIRGARIGVVRDFHGAGSHPGVATCLTEAIDALEALGAEIVDPADTPDTEGMGEAEYQVLLYEFKHGIERYLAAHDHPGGMRTLADLIDFNEAHGDRVMPYFGQEIFYRAQETGGLDDESYLEAREKARRLSRDAIDGSMHTERLDALIAPTNGPAWKTDLVNGDHYAISSSTLPAVSGYPNVTVPMCSVHGLPVGLSIFGAAYSETELLRIAAAFEEATQARQEPSFPDSLALE